MSLPWLWAIRQPTLVICGDDDPIAPQVTTGIMAALIPCTDLHHRGRRSRDVDG
jgi:poly(3-hydroxyoctanoate) depolymerase